MATTARLQREIGKGVLGQQRVANDGVNVNLEHRRMREHAAERFFLIRGRTGAITNHCRGWPNCYRNLFAGGRKCFASGGKKEVIETIREMRKGPCNQAALSCCRS